MYKIKLSPYHKIFYNEWKINPDLKYDIVFDQKLSSSLDLQKIRFAFARFIEDNLIFNSHIVQIEQELYWEKNDQIYDIEIFEDAHIDIKSYVNQSFNLATGPLYKAGIFKYSDGYRLIIVLNHILIDGTLFTHFVNELSNYYNDEDYKSRYNQIEQISQINSAIYDECHSLSNSRDALIFWNNVLADIEPVNLRFIGNKVTECNLIKEIKTIRFDFDESILKSLIEVNRLYNISSYGFGQIVFAILLHKYTYQENFGITFPMRVRKNKSLIFGSNVNTSIFPYSITKDTTVTDLIYHYKDFIRKSSRYKNILINDIMMNRDKKFLDIYFAQVDLQNTPFSFCGVDVLEISEEFYVCFGVKLDFEQSITTQNNQLSYRVRYNEATTDSNLLQQFIKHYQYLFLSILNDLMVGKNKIAASYSVLTDSELSYILSLNYINPLYNNEATIHQIFEAQAKANANKVALVFGNTTMTYGKLNEEANRLANYLLDIYAIKPNDFIALFVEQSIHTVIFILATLKCGAIYVPIDIRYPNSRIKYILDDAKPRLVISTQAYEQTISNLMVPGSRLLIIDKDTQYRKNDVSLHNPNIPIRNSDLAYIIYTSGTTGKPKGVLQSHRAVVQLFDATASKFLFDANDKWMLFHSYAFDFSVWEIWGALFYGGCLVIPHMKQITDLSSIYEMCLKESITVLNQTPSVFYQFIEIAKKCSMQKLVKLRYVIFGGEALNLRQLNQWITIYGYTQPFLVNMYGITETAVHNTFKVVDEDAMHYASVIGKPIENKPIYILDRGMQIAPIGAVGEIFTSGYGLAHGYLNNETASKEKFVANFTSQKFKLPSNDVYKKLYKTGDLATWLVNNDLEYIGRNDCQVKIRGYRIELKEIENTIRRYNGIMDVVLQTYNKNGGDKIVDSAETIMVAYYVAQQNIEEHSLIGYLTDILPHYMIPNRFVKIDKIPLTTSGKIDTKVLPKITHLSEECQLPETFEEKLVYEAFTKTLDNQDISINDSFFALGGNSILAIRLVAILQDNFEVTMEQIYKLRTVKQIASGAKYIKDNLFTKLNKIREIVSSHNCLPDMAANMVNNDDYLNSVAKYDFIVESKPMSNVLLSGATGFLGCHILHNLLLETNHKIYLLVRSNSHQDAYSRIASKFNFYFDVNLDDYQHRVVVLASNLAKKNFELPDNLYDMLINQVDIIIHSAALVKHYASYSEFREANIESTVNLLELCAKTKHKDFHYISTIGIFRDGYIPGYNSYVFNEDSGNELLIGKNNLYVETKYDGELLSKEYRNKGVKSSIYRVGNVFVNSQSNKIQQNFCDNAFYNTVKTLLSIGVFSKEFAEVEISPVDATAQAIVKLVNQANLNNQTYHLFNPQKVNLFNLLNPLMNDKLEFLEFHEFVDRLIMNLKNNNHVQEIELFMLNQLWLREFDANKLIRINVAQDRTSLILSRLKFTWPQVGSEMLKPFIL